MKHQTAKLFLSSLTLLGLITSCQAESASSNVSSSVASQASSSTAEEKGYVRGKVLSDTGDMMIAGIIVEDEKGNTYKTFTNSFGAYDIALNPGNYKLTFSKGYLFSQVTKEITVSSLSKLYLQDVRLTMLDDVYSKGWIAGDLHQHTYYSDGQDSVQTQIISNISEGLNYGFLSDHNVARGVAEWYGGSNFPVYKDVNGTTRYFHPFEAVEETSEFGHYQSLGVPLTFDRYDLELYAAERNSTNKDAITKDRISYIAESIKRAGGVAQINHPYSVSTMGFNYWELASQFDTMEIWNGYFAPLDGRYETEGQNYQSKQKWFELLNSGLYLPATGGTDNHDVSGPGSTSGLKIEDVNTYDEYYQYYINSGKYSGKPTTYLKTSDYSQAGVLAAIKAGHSFISNGPTVICSVNGKSYGETVANAGSTSYTVKTDIFNRDGMNFVKVVKNGQDIKKVTLDNVTSYNSDIQLDNIQVGDWIVIEVSGPGSEYAITNPIFFK
jgi:hypothetical protein